MNEYSLDSVTTDPSTLRSLPEVLQWAGDRLARDAQGGGATDCTPTENTRLSP